MKYLVLGSSGQIGSHFCTYMEKSGSHSAIPFDLVRDPAEIQKRKRAYWDQAFPGFKHLVLIKVVPERLEVISYKDGLTNSPEDFRPPHVEFPAR